MNTMNRAIAACLLAAGLLAAPVQAEPLKVGFVYVGPIGDHGWTYQHDQGRLAVEEAFGDQVETSYVENVPEGADADRVIAQLAETGHGLIFTTSFGYMNPTIRVAELYPDVQFEHATGYKQADNVATYSARFYEGRHVAGLLAGNMTESNVIGYIASFPIPEVVRGINAAFLAARSVNPDVSFKIVWVSTWFDPDKEGDTAKALIDQGADVILQHTDSPAALQVAQDRGVWAVGEASDMTAFGADAHLVRLSTTGPPTTSDGSRPPLTAPGAPRTPGVALAPTCCCSPPTTRPSPPMSSRWPKRPALRSPKGLSTPSPVPSMTRRAISSLPTARSRTTACFSA